jgi:hypothetical protein
MQERDFDLIRDRFCRPDEMLKPALAGGAAQDHTSEFIKRMAGTTR